MKNNTKEKAHSIRNYLFMLGFVVRNAPLLLFVLVKRQPRDLPVFSSVSRSFRLKDPQRIILLLFLKHIYKG